MDFCVASEAQPQRAGGPHASAPRLTAQGRNFLARILGALRAFDPETQGLRFPLAELDECDRPLVDAILGSGARCAAAAGDPRREARETGFAGLWRCQVLAVDDATLFDWLEVCDVPGFVAETIRAETRPSPHVQSHVRPAAIPETGGLAALARRILAIANLSRSGQDNVTVRLNPSQDPASACAQLRRCFGDTGVELALETAAGMARAHATGRPGVWVVCHEAGEGVSCHAEIGDVPDAFRASRGAPGNSAERLERALELLACEGRAPAV
ncbi:MAG: hypothetical protein H6884_07365 [Rhodobiaceae bacterium]|nr:hypothetical protein [Rhodobiaceae bacterium]MCC0053861.1 hypothetical protein [Rhodobiaceae bacterium]